MNPDSEGKTELHTHASPSQPIRRELESVDDFEHLESSEFSAAKESARNLEDELHEDLAAQKFEMYPERDDFYFDQPKQPAHDFGLDFPETKQFETSKAESDPKFDPLDDFLSGGSGGNLPPMKSGSPQHFAEPIKDSPTSAGKDIMDTMSFLQHESQPHFTPAAAAAAGDTFMDSQFSAEKEDYSLEDEVIRHKTPSPDLLPEAVNVGGSNSMDDFEFPTNDKKPLSSYPDPFDDFLSKQENKSKPAPVPVPEPVQEPPPVPVRELSPKPREPSPLPVRDYSPIRDPTPEPRDPTPEPPPKPKAPAPSVFESDIFEKKPEKKEHKESEPKPVISKPTSPPPAPPKQVALGDSKSCDGLGECQLFI